MPKASNLPRKNPCAWGSGERARCVEQYQQERGEFSTGHWTLVIAIALATPVLGGPESVRVVLNSSSRILPPSRV